MNRRSPLLFVSALIFICLLLNPVLLADRFEGELKTNWELQPLKDDQLFSGDSYLEWKTDFLQGEIEDYPGVLKEVLFWPKTNLVDTGWALRGLADFPFLTEEEGSLQLNGYLSREFGRDYPVGTWGGSSKLSFSEEGLGFWASKFILNYGGFSYRGKFVLEEGEPPSVGLGSGLELSISGTKFSGVAVEARARFGMRPDPREFVPGGKGSGYDVFGPGGEKLLGYTGSEVTLESLRLGPCRFDATSVFSAARGFESTTFYFSAEEKEFPLELEGDLTFTTQTKSVSLRPELDLKWACLEVYSRWEPQSLTGVDTLTGFAIEGFGIEEVQMGGVRGGMKVALGGVTLYKEQEIEDYWLRADRYRFSGGEDFNLYYERTEYDGVLSLEGGGGNLYLAADFYWGGKEGIFDLGLVTGEAEYKLSDSFELRCGLEVIPTEGIGGIALQTSYLY